MRRVQGRRVAAVAEAACCGLCPRPSPAPSPAAACRPRLLFSQPSAQTSAPSRLLIIGGGISGLASAYYLLHPELLHSSSPASSSSPLSPPSVRALPRSVVQLVEAEQRVGGWICTRRLSSPREDQSFLFELGPRSLLTRRGDATLQLVGCLGLASSLSPSLPPPLLLSDSSARRRFLWNRPRQRALLLPTGINSSLLRFPFTTTVLSSVLHELRTPARAAAAASAADGEDGDDESVHSFVSRRFSRELADELIDPLVAGIYSGDVSRLSVRSCFPALYRAELEHGGVLRAQWRQWRSKRARGTAAGHQQQQPQRDAWLQAVRSNGTYSFRDGMETLSNALQAAIEGEKGARGEGDAHGAAGPVIRTGQRVERLCFDRQGVVAVINGREERYDSVLSTVSAPALAKILQRSSVAADTGSQDTQMTSIPPSASPSPSSQPLPSAAPLTSGLIPVSSPASLSSSALLTQLAASLHSLSYASVWVVSVGYDAAVLPHTGFGLLCGSSHSDDVLGIAFDSCVFPQQNSSQQQTRLTVMLGGARFPHLASLSAAEVEQRALAALQRMLGVTRPPSVLQATLTRDCIPQYVVGHHAWLRAVERAVTELNSRLGSERLQLLGNALHGVSVNDLISHSRLLAARHHGLAGSEQ